VTMATLLVDLGMRKEVLIGDESLFNIVEPVHGVKIRKILVKITKKVKQKLTNGINGLTSWHKWHKWMKWM
jgi:hypothetical protein